MIYLYICISLLIVSKQDYILHWLHIHPLQIKQELLVWFYDPTIYFCKVLCCELSELIACYIFNLVVFRFIRDYRSEITFFSASLMLH